MTLQQGDIAGATATGKASKPGAGYTVGYTRDLATARRYGGSRIVYVDSAVAVAPTSAVRRAGHRADPDGAADEDQPGRDRRLDRQELRARRERAGDLQRRRPHATDR